tara:strand:- start:633 stop:1013 length:381 start_codon:yes stop_codon:yes gene_type:complete
MNINEMNQDLNGEMGDDFYEVIVTVIDSIMKQAAGDDEVMKIYELLFQSMFENVLLYNYVVSAGLVKNPGDVLKMKNDVEAHIERIAEKRKDLVEDEENKEEVDEEDEVGVWSMDQMKEFMEGKEI